MDGYLPGPMALVKVADQINWTAPGLHYEMGRQARRL
jgi:hypothetical protein